MNPELDRHKSTINHHQNFQILKEYIESNNLCDIWRIRNPDAKRYTWHRPANKSASRIDFFLVPHNIYNMISECEINPVVHTDHSILEMIIEMSNQERGPGFWKFNNQLLNDNTFKENMIEIITKTLDDNKLFNPKDQWSILKINMIKYCKQYSRMRAKNFNEEFNELCKNKDRLLEELLRDDGTEHDNISGALATIENSLECHNIQKTESAAFRAKCNWAQNGEIPSKMFFNLEKKNYLNKNLSCLFRDNGQLTYDQTEILDEQTRYYKKLYTAEGRIKFNIQREKYDPQINTLQREACDRELTVDEIFDAVVTLKSNKVGGPDGLSAEFYQCFFKQLKTPLLQMYTFAYSKGVLPLSTHSGLITLLPKKNKDTRYVKNLCPLTMLNIEDKILAKAMENRLKEIIPTIVCHDQTGFVNNRQITSNIRKSLDVMVYCAKNWKPAVILSIHMEKCFNRISYGSIFGTLRLFNFGNNFVKWVSLFYSDFRVCTHNYGFRSTWFTKTRSVNQGCNISPSIFLLNGELLALRLCNNNLIHGIKIGNKEILISQFADDMDLYLPYDRTILNEVIRTLDYIEANTGLKTLYEKTTVYRIGSLKNTQAKLYTTKKLQWSNNYINTLGIDLHHENIDQNFQTVICKMRTISKLWYYRHLTLMGKIVIVNTLFNSLFVYKMQMIHEIDEKYFQEAESVILDFIWAGKNPKISLKILMQSKQDGGLGLANLRAKHTALSVKNLQSIYQNEQLLELAKYFWMISHHLIL